MSCRSGGYCRQKHSTSHNSKLISHCFNSKAFRFRSSLVTKSFDSNPTRSNHFNDLDIHFLHNKQIHFPWGCGSPFTFLDTFLSLLALYTRAPVFTWSYVNWFPLQLVTHLVTTHTRTKKHKRYPKVFCALWYLEVLRGGEVKDCARKNLFGLGVWQVFFLVGCWHRFFPPF